MNNDRLDDLSEAIFAIADKVGDRIVEQRKHKMRSMILEDLTDNLRSACKHDDVSWLSYDFGKALNGIGDIQTPCITTLVALFDWLQNYITEEGAWIT